MNVQALLDHQNVLKVYGAFEDSTFIYMVQQLARKGDVYRTYLQDRTKLTEAHLASRIIAPLLRALDHARTRGVIHRDIKPENVFLSENEEVLLGDWGLGIDNVQERPVSRVGTLDYMAPEVLRSPSIPPGQNFRAYSKEPGSYEYTVRSLYVHKASTASFLDSLHLARSPNVHYEIQQCRWMCMPLVQLPMSSYTAGHLSTAVTAQKRRH